MAIRCECRHCKTEFLAPDQFAGKRIACPVCQRSVYPPGPMPAAPATPGSPPVQPPSPAVQAGPVKTPTLFDAIEEELGPGVGAAGGGNAAAPWSPLSHGSRSAIRLSRKAAIAVLILGSIAFLALVLFIAPKLGLLLGWLVLAGGLVLVFSGVCWQLYVALREQTSCLVWSIVCPFYFLYFLLTRWDRTRKAFWTLFGGLAVCGGAIGAIVYAEIRIAQAPAPAKTERPARPRSEPRSRKPVSWKETSGGKNVSNSIDRSSGVRYLVPRGVVTRNVRWRGRCRFRWRAGSAKSVTPCRTTWRGDRSAARAVRA
jgi:hypothetical protein